MANFFEGSLYSLGFLSLLLIIECLTRRKKFPKEITRRIAHIASGLFGAVMGFVLEPWIFITFVLFFLAIITISYSIKFLSSIHGVKRKTYGEVLLPIGILITYLLAGGASTIYLATILILALSDPIGGLIGDLKPDIKRLAGSVAFFISCLVILLMFFGLEQFGMLFVIALAVTGIEKVTTYGTDNILVPVFASLLLKVLLQS